MLDRHTDRVTPTAPVRDKNILHIGPTFFSYKVESTFLFVNASFSFMKLIIYIYILVDLILQSLNENEISPFRFQGKATLIYF